MAAQQQVTLAQLQRNAALEARLLQQEAASQEAAARSEALQAVLAAQHVAQQQQSSTLAARVQELEQQLRCGHPGCSCCTTAVSCCNAALLCPAAYHAVSVGSALWQRAQQAVYQPPRYSDLLHAGGYAKQLSRS
jgi:hypothetical protein